MSSRSEPLAHRAVGALLVLAAALLTEACLIGLPMVAAMLAGRTAPPPLVVRAAERSPREAGPVPPAGRP
jgi:hypothetical protein